MKVVIILGDSAVGKMTVGQELSKITGLCLFHNHMIIEPVLSLYGYFKGDLIQKLRDIVYEDFSKSQEYGIILTFQFAFDSESDWSYLRNVEERFLEGNSDTEFYYVELDCNKEERLRRNRTENRLNHKPSKRDVLLSEKRMLMDDMKNRFESEESEISWKNFLKIDNSEMPAEEVAKKIKKKFQL